MKICEVCGDEFQESRSNQLYCSDCGKNSERAREHYKRAEIINKIHAGDLYKVEEITCVECGKKILTTYNRTFCSTSCSEKHRIKTAKCPVCHTLLIDNCNNTGRGYCSEECRQKNKLQKAIEKGNYVPCECCGKKFIRKNYSNRFCSMGCYKRWSDEEREKKIAITNSIRATIEETGKKCEYCGELYVWKKEQPGQRFCSIDCRKEQTKLDKQKSTESLNLGKELHICTICKALQSDCERFTSNFVYKPKGSIGKTINNKYIIISCPKFK